MQGVDFRLTHLLVVAVEPQVVRTVAPEVLLVATKVQVPHLCFYVSNETIIIIIININLKDIEFQSHNKQPNGGNFISSSMCEAIKSAGRS